MFNRGLTRFPRLPVTRSRRMRARLSIHEKFKRVMSVREKASLLVTRVAVVNKLPVPVAVVRGKWLVQSAVVIEELINGIGNSIRFSVIIAPK